MSKRITALNVLLKLAYESAVRGDAARALFDRLWPRGMTKKTTVTDEWINDIASNDAVREWFDHNSAVWPPKQTVFQLNGVVHAKHSN